MEIIFYSMRLNETRKNLASNPERSPLMREPRSKTYGVSASPEACICRVAALAKGGNHWLRATPCSYMLQDSPFGAYSAIRIRRCNFLVGRSMPAKSRLDSGLSCKPEIPIGLAPRLLCYGYASAGDRPALFARFPLMFVPFMQYAG